MLLYWKPVAEKIKEELKSKSQKYFPNADYYMAILFFWDNSSSKVYVKHKQKYWEEMWIPTKIFWQDSSTERTKEKIIELIEKLNGDEKCIWIIVQLPLPEKLSTYKNEILSAITPEKDVDGLWWDLVGKSFFWMINFTPATPKAVMSLLDFYNLWDLRNKRVAIIWQSTIVGKPLAIECIKRGAQMACFDINNTPAEIKWYCKHADYIFSWTGQIHLIDENYINDEKNQIVVDIWYWHLEWVPVGDVNFEKIKDKVLHITPVPWGVWPLTIASLFSNIFDLWEQFHK